MASTNINIRTDSNLKEQAQIILNDLGLDLSTAINVFLKQVVRNEAIPFEISRSPYPSVRRARPGGWEGKIRMSDDFNEPMDDFQELME